MPDKITIQLGQVPYLRLRLAKWIVLVLLQGASALFFIGDVTTELLDAGFVTHTVLEGTATLALVCGVIFGSFEIWRLMRRANNADESLAQATASFSALVHERFKAWELSEAEVEVAMLLLKGFDISEIAQMRQTAAGTVRAQLSNIYQKSGQPGRGRFVSSFIDVLIETPVGSSTPGQRGNPGREDAGAVPAVSSGAKKGHMPE